jgi:hypothetical protein
MEDPMTRFTSTSRRFALSALAAFAMAALPQASLAANGDGSGLWKVNTSKSKVGSDVSRLVIERVKASEGTTGTFLVINRGNAYLATPAGSSDGIQPANYSAWKGMTLTKIGTGVRTIEDCFARCQYGQLGKSLKVTFRNVGTPEQMSGVLALNQ